MVATVGMVTPGSVRPGSTFWVGFATDKPSQDYIDIAQAGAADSATPLVRLDTTWQAVGQILMNVPATATPGAYELRLRQGGSGVTIATAPLAVVSASPPGTGTPPGQPAQPAPPADAPPFDPGALLKKPAVLIGLVVVGYVLLGGGRKGGLF